MKQELKRFEPEEWKEKWIAERTNAVSEMLDNPYDSGIYKTSELFERLDRFVFALQSRIQQLEAATPTTSFYELLAQEKQAYIDEHQGAILTNGDMLKIYDKVIVKLFGQPEETF